MATNSTSNQPVQPENEIDLIEVVKKLWQSGNSFSR